MKRTLSPELDLPAPPVPVGAYRLFKRIGDIVYLSGQGPLKEDGTYYVGRLGQDVSVSEAYEHARIAGKQLLAVLHSIVEDIQNVEIIKVFGMVNADSSFSEHTKIIDGCSDLFIETLGEKGHHARSAVGMNSLPNGMTVEVEAIVRIKSPAETAANE